MEDAKHFIDQLLEITPANFTQEALKLFKFQATHNPVYNKYLRYLQVDPTTVTQLTDIPFLPIGFFKTQQVILTGAPAPQVLFESSGTTGSQKSQHWVADTELYFQVATSFFEQTYGPLSSFHVFALLPSYLERKGSSLVAMADHFIQRSQSPYSGFYLDNYQALIKAVQQARKSRRVLLMGVSFALLDLAEQYALDWYDVVVMETGGMKGRRAELTRDALHRILQEKFQVTDIHSEYGMTELLSQAYALRQGRFRTPPWMKILIRDPNDPFDLQTVQHTGGINVIDMANVYSCAFIETQDLGRRHPEEDTFEVLGRFDNSDIRGCNLMVN